MDYSLIPSIIHLLRDGLMPGDLAYAGVVEDDYRALRQNKVLTYKDRTKVIAAVEAITNWTINLAGLPQINIPIEVKAVVIASIVRSRNLWIVAGWCAEGHTAESLRNAVVGRSVQQSQMVAYVLQASSTEGIDCICDDIDRAVGIAVANATQRPEEIENVHSK